MTSGSKNTDVLRILFVGKRFYTNRDALTERFGRIYQFPYCWSEVGHEVDLWLIDYHGSKAEALQDGSLAVESTPVLGWRFFARWAKSCFPFRRSRRPDIIVASGDCYIGLVAYIAAVFSRARFVFDVYDRYDVFEGYRRLPGFDPLSFLIRRADIATFASAKVLDEFRLLAGRSYLAQNGVDQARFKPLPQRDSREMLGLPLDATLVGYFGSMEPERGITDLIDAIAALQEECADIRLVVGGKSDAAVDLEHPWIIYLGNVEFSHMPTALASCDVLTLPYRKGTFVDNASSCKIAEYIAVQRPIVATRSPNLTENFPKQAKQLAELLATPGDPAALRDCLRAQLLERRLVEMPNDMDWRSISKNTLTAIVGFDSSG